MRRKLFLILSCVWAQVGNAGTCFSHNTVNIEVHVEVKDIHLKSNSKVRSYFNQVNTIQGGMDIDKGSVENILNSTEYGPPLLMVAIRSKNIEAVRSLLEMGADPSLTYRGKPALSLAKKTGNKEIIDLLIGWTPQNLNLN